MNTYEQLVIKHLNRKISKDQNPDQNQAIAAPISESQFLVAGPGSGKTTVMVLKILKYIYVDDVHPASILATTFTKKAAAELRSRILDWGDTIKQVLLKKKQNKDIHASLKVLDFNQILTGTIDSISEEVLRNHRKPGSAPPVVIEDFVASALLLRKCFFPTEMHKDEELENYLKQIRGREGYVTINEKLELILEIKDRLYYDQVHWDEFKTKQDDPGGKKACQIIEDYMELLDESLLYDFARVEAEFLDQLNTGKLDDFTQHLKLLMVDEYQDSNLLQERIYFQLAEKALQNGGSITVVGDDDQSLYRFRGATVDLFTQYQDRIQDQLGVQPTLVNLSRNYRSIENIVNFVNQFSYLDPAFQEARVKDKPPIEPARGGGYLNYPILGIFREDTESLSRALADFIHQVVHGDGYRFQYKGKTYQIQVDPNEGSATDLSILMSSPQEITTFKKQRLPYFLRKDLKEKGIEVFNPRGENLEREKNTSILSGLILECIDPECTIQNMIEKLPHVASKTFNHWRKLAKEYIISDPEPKKPLSLQKFVKSWQNRSPIGRKSWKREVPLIDLVYNLVTWISQLHDDVEGMVYLEAITRTISLTGLFSSFGGDIITDPEQKLLEYLSIKEALWNIFVPISTGAVEVDEGLLETLPQDRLNIMSIHQSKGLEFPLVIVDIGSDLKTNHPFNAFKRFPEDGGKSCNMEDELRTYSPLEQPSRTSIDRAFDDLIRQYFVAFSRSMDILILVGLNSVRDGYMVKAGPRVIPHVAAGWTRNGDWTWKNLKNIVHI